MSIAIYHCNIKVFSRGKGKSAVAAAAYRAGEKITNEYDRMIHDYTRKGEVVHTEILLPDHAPSEYSDRAVLWNAVEKIEKAKNSHLSREIEIALPNELSAGQNLSLVQHLAQCDNYKQHKGIYEKYIAFSPKKRDAFYDKQSEKIQLYENAKGSLVTIMNGKTTMPIKAWQAEQVKLTADRFSLCEDFYKLKDEVWSVEVLRKGVENFMCKNEQAQKTHKDKGMGL